MDTPDRINQDEHFQATISEVMDHLKRAQILLDGMGTDIVLYRGEHLLININQAIEHFGQAIVALTRAQLNLATMLKQDAERCGPKYATPHRHNRTPP